MDAAAADRFDDSDGRCRERIAPHIDPSIRLETLMSCRPTWWPAVSPASRPAVLRRVARIGVAGHEGRALVCLVVPYGRRFSVDIARKSQGRTYRSHRRRASALQGSRWVKSHCCSGGLGVDGIR
jgi:hypothetical protein